MSTDLVKAEREISILEKKDWNNEKDLILFKKEFVGAQNLQSAIKDFYKSFLLSKIIKESDLINMPDVNWFYVSEGKSPASWSWGVDQLSIEFYYTTRLNLVHHFKYYNETNRTIQRIIIDGYTKTTKLVTEEVNHYNILRLVSFCNQSELVEKLGGREFLERVKEKHPEQIKNFMRYISIISNEILKDERYWIINEYGQPLLVSTEKSLEFLKIKLLDDDRILQVQCPIVNDWSPNFCGESNFDVHPGTVVKLDFDVATNKLIRYSI